MEKETNPFYKKSPPKAILPFYNRASELLPGKGDTKALEDRIKGLENIHNI